ncbi:MAG: helix-turn-helix transcriptional regulator, partial [Desulfobulbaceae bacterium]|nr:helix-turn-helix transcriptional regulator [Desulfobulbaceae bacterium]
MSKPDTKHRILDAAERLFADKGYHNTSLRNITSAAKANLASVNYHFGSKEALISEVMDRRLAPINKIRTER